MSKLLDMLRTSAMADKAKALLTLDLLQNRPVGIGDHSTGDFYKNAEEALSMLVDADDRLAALDRYFVTIPNTESKPVETPKSKKQLNG
jgi:hypothetical protein